MIVDLRCPQCNRTIDASKQEVVTCGQQVVDQVYMKHQWCARCDVAIMIVMGADGTAYEVRSRRHHRAGETVQVPVKPAGTPDFSQAGWEEA